MRAFLGILAGILVGLGLQTCGDVLASWLYPIVVHDIWDQAELGQAYAVRSSAASLLSVAGYFAGAVGGAIAGKLVWRRPTAAWVPGVLLALMALAISISFPLALWVKVASVVAPLMGAWIGNAIVRTAAPAAHDGTADGALPADVTTEAEAPPANP
jgi:MFS family permease